MSLKTKNFGPYDTKAKQQKLAIIEKYAPLVKKIAGRFSYRLPPDIDIEDLIQVGMIGLMESIERFDETKDANFKTFAEYRIRGSMLDELRSRDWIPRSVRSNAKKLEQAFLALKKKSIEQPTNDQLATELGLTIEEFDEFLIRNQSIGLFSLDFMGKSTEDNSLSILDILANPEEMLIDEKMISEELVAKMVATIKKLPERDQLILSLSFKEELNLKEISHVLNITEARVCQLRTKLIGYLRSELYSRN